MDAIAQVGAKRVRVDQLEATLFGSDPQFGAFSSPERTTLEVSVGRQPDKQRHGHGAPSGCPQQPHVAGWDRRGGQRHGHGVMRPLQPTLAADARCFPVSAHQ